LDFIFGFHLWILARFGAIQSWIQIWNTSL